MLFLERIILKLNWEGHNSLKFNEAGYAITLYHVTMPIAIIFEQRFYLLNIGNKTDDERKPI
jgi:hypothetical protein